MIRKLEKNFELIPHTADLKIRAWGIDIKELFRNSLIGMFSVIKPKSEYISYKEDLPQISKFTSERNINLNSINQQSLLIDFLSECLYLSDVNNEAYFDANFGFINQTALSGKIYGVEITGFEVVEIKAVTYNDIEVEFIDGLWVATIVFDI